MAESERTGQPGWPGEQLVLAAQNGDTESIATLVSGSYPHVMRFSRTLCASPSDAEEAAQEALIILYRKIGMLRASGALASWMFRVVRNECLRRARLALRREEVLWDGAADSLEADGNLEDDILHRLEAERVATAVAALPDGLRRVLVMRDIQGYSGHQVATVLGLTTAAMKSRLHRARATVRAVLEFPADPPPRPGSGGFHG